MLPQYTVALKVSRNYSKMAYLKQSKSRIVHLFSSFYSSQCCALTQEVTQPPTVREFPKDCYFVLSCAMHTRVTLIPVEHAFFLTRFLL